MLCPCAHRKSHVGVDARALVLYAQARPWNGVLFPDAPGKQFPATPGKQFSALR